MQKLVNHVDGLQRQKPGRPRIYPFDELQQGECRTIPGKKRDQIAASLAAAERRTGFAFFAYDFHGGVRVCRFSADREEHEKQMKAARKARRAQRARFQEEYRQNTVPHPGG